jgi:spoIIIJ-associated protein
MTKVEAPTLEEAYREASLALECSISELQYEVIQYPTKGIFGFLKKNAIIVVTCKTSDTVNVISENIETSTASEIVAIVKDNPEEIIEQSIEKKIEKDLIVEHFFEVDTASKNNTVSEKQALNEENVVYSELALLIENQLKTLFSHSCFGIDVIEVDVVENTALIFIDGEDAALLIGKEGYRYNALSYMLFNWLHTKYELFIKLEIAEFLTSQQKMIRNYIKPVIENVNKYGKGKTRSLDGILVQIALEQLREIFPEKYVAVKTGREGNKFVVINEFNNKIYA